MICIKCKKTEKGGGKGEKEEESVFSLEKRRRKGADKFNKDTISLGTATGYQLDLHWSRLTS